MYVQVHNRSAFTDFEVRNLPLLSVNGCGGLHMPATKLFLQEEDRKRHLLRMWLAPQDGWELPEHFAERYHTVAKGEL